MYIDCANFPLDEIILSLFYKSLEWIYRKKKKKRRKKNDSPKWKIESNPKGKKESPIITLISQHFCLCLHYNHQRPCLLNHFLHWKYKLTNSKIIKQNLHLRVKWTKEGLHFLIKQWQRYNYGGYEAITVSWKSRSRVYIYIPPHVSVQITITQPHLPLHHASPPNSFSSHVSPSLPPISIRYKTPLPLHWHWKSK